MGRSVDRDERRRIVGYGFVAGMVLAPVLALVYGWNVGLAVMGLALAATTAIGIDTLRGLPNERDRLRWLIGVNAVLCMACFVLLAVRAI